MRSLVVVLNVRTSLFTAPSTIWRTQATTVSPACARAGSCEYQDRHNVDAELPLLLLKCRRPGTPLWKSRTRAPGPLPARDTIWGAQGFRVRLTDGLARTKITPTSVPTAQRQPTPKLPPVSYPAGRELRWGARTKQSRATALDLAAVRRHVNPAAGPARTSG